MSNWGLSTEDEFEPLNGFLVVHGPAVACLYLDIFPRDALGRYSGVREVTKSEPEELLTPNNVKPLAF